MDRYNTLMALTKRQELPFQCHLSIRNWWASMHFTKASWAKWQCLLPAFPISTLPSSCGGAGIKASREGAGGSPCHGFGFWLGCVRNMKCFCHGGLVCKALTGHMDEGNHGMHICSQRPFMWASTDFFPDLWVKENSLLSPICTDLQICLMQNIFCIIIPLSPDCKQTAVL